MVKNITYHNPVYQEENTPLVTITDVRTDLDQATAIDSRKSPYNVNLAKASFGATYYPVVGSQWYLKKISGVWTLMARAPQQNPQLSPTNTPKAGETYLGGEGDTHITGNLVVGGIVTAAGDPEVGSIKLYAGNTPPTGWAICDGSPYSRTTYALLYSRVGTTYGVGDGSTTFNIPDLRERVAVGFKSGSAEFGALNQSGGEKTHVLLTAELAGHNHTVGAVSVGNQSANHTHSGSTLATSDPGAFHSHNIGRDHDTTSGSFGWSVHTAGTSGAGATSPTDAAGSHTHTITGSTDIQSANHNHALTGNTDSTGSGTGHNNIQPYLTLNYIIKVTGVFTPPVSTGTVVNATTFNAVGTLATDVGYTATIGGDTFKRYTVHDDGKIEWGTGTALPDANLYRNGVASLTTDGNINGNSVTVQPLGEAVPRIKLNNSTTGITFSDGTNAADTTITRSAAGTLSMPSSGGLNVTNQLSVQGVSIQPTGAAVGSVLRHDGTKYVSIIEGMRNIGFTRQTNPAVNSSSTTYFNIGTAVTVTKALAGSRLRVQVGGTAYGSVNSIELDWGISVAGGADIDIASIGSTNSVPLQHGSWGGMVYVSGAAAGSITVQLRGKVQGTGSMRMDVADWFYIDVCECA